MKNQKLMINQKNFEKRLRKFQRNISSQLWGNHGDWNLGLNVPVVRLQCNSPIVMTFPGGPSIAKAIP